MNEFKNDVLELIRRDPDPGEHEAIRELWKRHSKAEDSRDLPGLISTLTEDCVYELVQTGHRWEGHEGAARFYGGLLGAFPDIDFQLTDIVIGPQGVCEEADVTGTHEAEWLGIPPSGRTPRLEGRDLLPVGREAAPLQGRARLHGWSASALARCGQEKTLAGNKQAPGQMVAAVDAVDRVAGVACVVPRRDRPERVAGLHRVPHFRAGAVRGAGHDRPRDERQSRNQKDLPEHVFAMLTRTSVRRQAEVACRAKCARSGP